MTTQVEIKDLNPVVTPAATDLFVGQQTSGDSLNYTPAQIANAISVAAGSLPGATFISTGTTTARSFEDRGADAINVKDYGAVLNGSASDSTAFQDVYNAVPNDGVINIPIGNLNASLTPSASKAVLWRTLGSFDYGTSAPGTNPVTSFGDGDVLETFLEGRKRFSKSCVTNQEAYATVEVDLDWSSTNPNTSFVNSALVVAGTNNATGTSGGVWSGNFFVTANTAISDNFAIAGTATINGTGWAGVAYLQLMDNAGTSGDVNVHEFDLFTQNADAIGTSGPISGLRAIGSWNLATVTGKTTAQASRGLSVVTIGSASIGSVFFTGANIYNAAFDCAQATFASSSVASLRMAPNQFIDLTGDYATGALNTHALGYSTSSTSLEYQVSGAAVFSISDTGATSSTFFAGSVGTGLTAAGTTQGTAYAITTQSSVFTNVASGTGAMLPSVKPGTIMPVLNRGANALTLYPFTGQSFETLAANAPISIPPGSSNQIIYAGGTQCYVI
ncbi:MAG: hypothetical protein KGI54_14265 [Pseudomonadota bacterium]|nr:hypothetical protein [Pseudomonadota bacterium]